MALRRRVNCFTCNLQGNIQNMPHLGNDENKRQLAEVRRAEFGFPEQNIVDETRICFNCNNALVRDIAAVGEDFVRLNVIIQKHGRACFICHENDGVTRLSIECRVFAFVHYDLFIPDNTRVCPRHLNANGQIISAIINGIRYINRPYVLRGEELQIFLHGLQQAAQGESRLDKADDFDDSEFECLFPITKVQFEDLFNNYCPPVPEYNVQRYVKKKILWFFCASYVKDCPTSF